MTMKTAVETLKSYLETVPDIEQTPKQISAGVLSIVLFPIKDKLGIDMADEEFLESSKYHDEHYKAIDTLPKEELAWYLCLINVGSHLNDYISYQLLLNESINGHIKETIDLIDKLLSSSDIVESVCELMFVDDLDDVRSND